jgi:alkylhydroperoxidase family enzyme
MPRIKVIELAQCEDRVRRCLEAQEKEWGAPLTPSAILARNPTLFTAVRGMWGALGSSTVLNPSLEPLVNRRVAALNGCVF